ncbi:MULTISPECIES: hypothetical protein [unclassified Microcoleus]|uniref:hypothetical protein n=1 Tax=unclassified Microcoleus TaxID=2642155 RepID=UPI002FD4642A
MKSKKFWHRLVAVITLTVFFLTIQVPILSNQAWAAGETIFCTIETDKMSHTDHLICNETTNTNNTNNTTVIIHPPGDSGKAEAFVAGVVVGALGGSATTIATVSGAGSVAGLSAAGVTSGLAAIGSVAGGGMVAGLAVSASVPVIAAVSVGYLAYKGWELLHPPQNVEITP